MSISSIALALLLLLVAAGAGVSVADRMPWRAQARSAGLSVAVGFGLAPFIAGLCMVLVLAIGPSLGHRGELALTFALIVGIAVAARVGAPSAWWIGIQRPSRAGMWFLACLGGYGAALVFDAVYLPLMQNDALEYAMVARELHASRDLSTYPVLDSVGNVSGFYGPWTHPPLYVALLSLADLVQGSSDTPVLLRFISPWCHISAALIVFATGRIGSDRAGALAGSLLLSTPLLFLGAASALIDPLPILGVALSFAVASMCEGGVRSLGGWSGLVIGLALWAHSEAVLVPFLTLPIVAWVAFCTGSPSGRWSRAIWTASVAGLVALLAGAWPYLRNFAISGALVSDSPLVFSIASLDWDSYFKFHRGLVHAADILQYGFLKGLFAVESYSIAYWVSLLGIPLGWHTLRAIVPGGRPSQVVEGADRMAGAAFLACMTYMAFLVVAIALEVYEPIRNDRYAMITLPAAVILGALGLDWMQSRGSVWRRLAMCVIVVVAVAVVVQLVVLVAYRVGLAGSGYSTGIAAGREARLSGWKPYGAMRYLAEKTPGNALVLSMKPADMFYARRRMISYLDPRLGPFYAARSVSEAHAALRALGVTHVQMPDYGLPPFYNSQLMTLLADPRWSVLMFDGGGYQIYGLSVSAGTEFEQCRVLPLSGDWVQSSQIVLGGRKSFVRRTILRDQVSLGAVSRSWSHIPVFQREVSTTLVSQVVPLSSGWHGYAYGLDVELAGSGHVQISILLTLPDGREERRLVGDVPVVPERGAVSYSRLVRPDHAVAMRIEIEHRGRSEVRILKAVLREWCGDRDRSSQ